VDLSDLTPAEANALAERLAPMLGYMVRLTNRMQKLAWQAHDPVYRAVWEARDAMHELTVRVRYQACGNAGGRGNARKDVEECHKSLSTSSPVQVGSLPKCPTDSVSMRRCCSCHRCANSLT
jgi:hypothetical protein